MDKFIFNENEMSSENETLNGALPRLRNFEEVEAEKIKEKLMELESFRITTKTEVPPEEPTVTVDGIGVFAKRDIHAVKAKQKQGKTTIMKVILAVMFIRELFRLKSPLKDPKVLWLDTEQKQSDVKLVLTDVQYLTNLPDDYIDEHICLYHLRKRTYKTLNDDLTLLVKTHHPDVVFIDGVVEFVDSFNDETFSRETIQKLMILAEEENCAIINVLHENKSADDDNMRGHLGTMLAQAAGTVVECKKSNKGIITVASTDPRHAPMPSWSVKFDSDGHIVDADALYRQEQLLKKEEQNERRQAKKEERNRERKDAAVQIVRNNGGSMLRKDLKQELKAKLKLGDSSVQEIIRVCLESELKMVNGRICLLPSESQNEPTT